MYSAVSSATASGESGTAPKLRAGVAAFFGGSQFHRALADGTFWELQVRDDRGRRIAVEAGLAIGLGV